MTWWIEHLSSALVGAGSAFVLLATWYSRRENRLPDPTKLEDAIDTVGVNSADIIRLKEDVATLKRFFVPPVMSTASARSPDGVTKWPPDYRTAAISTVDPVSPDVKPIADAAPGDAHGIHLLGGGR